MVEDETDVLALNARYFEARGYEVKCAKTPEEARVLLWEWPPGLVLLDARMPDGSGYDFCAETRKLTAALIIYLTCMSLDDNVIRGLNKSVDDYITKPYRLDGESPFELSITGDKRYMFQKVRLAAGERN